MRKIAIIFTVLLNHSLWAQSYDPNRMEKVEEAIKLYLEKSFGIDEILRILFPFASDRERFWKIIFSLFCSSNFY